MTSHRSGKKPFYRRWIPDSTDTPIGYRRFELFKYCLHIILAITISGILMYTVFRRFLGYTHPETLELMKLLGEFLIYMLPILFAILNAGDGLEWFGRRGSPFGGGQPYQPYQPYSPYQPYYDAQSPFSSGSPSGAFPVNQTPSPVAQGRMPTKPPVKVAQ
jgi:hypothetical protein